MSVGKLERLPLRQVWKHEAHDFTTWLEDNFDVLNEVLDFNLLSVEREKPAGRFSVDLVGEDENGDVVVIENQLEKSNHDHLGKVITYLTALEAKTAVWIVSNPRPEHIKAITWLNEATSTPFYLIKVEAVKIGGSAPAPLFTKIVGPSVEGRAAFQVRQGLTERHLTRQKFWTALLNQARERTKLHANISPNTRTWLGTAAGMSGLTWNYGLLQHETHVELYIDRGVAEDNMSVFQQLLAKKEAIESAFGTELIWQQLDGKRACRIKCKLAFGGWRDEEKWPQAIEKTIDAMIRFEAALRSPVKKLKR